MSGKRIPINRLRAGGRTYPRGISLASTKAEAQALHLLAGLLESRDVSRWLSRRLGLPEDSVIGPPAVETEGEFGDLAAHAPDGALRGWIQLHLGKAWRGEEGRRRTVHRAPVYSIALTKRQGPDLSLEEMATHLEGAYCVLDEEGRRAATAFRDFVAAAKGGAA